MGKIQRQQVASLKERHDELMEDIAGGMKVVDVFEKYKVGRRAFYKYLESEPGIYEEYHRCKKIAGHVYAAKALQAAEEATKDDVNVKRLLSDQYRWSAAKQNPDYDVRQKDITVNVKVEDLHAQMAAIVGAEAEAELLDLDEAEYSEIDCETDDLQED
jgi:hypothetical protein